MTEALSRIHHDGSGAYVSNASPAIGDTVRVALRVPRSVDPDVVAVRSVLDGEPKVQRAHVLRQDGPDTWWFADLEIRQPLTHYRWLLTGGSAGYLWHTAAGNVDHDSNDASDFQIAAHEAAPAWACAGVVYQIYPDRFASSGRTYPLPRWAVRRDWDRHPEGRGRHTSHEYFGGDLWGIIDHLAYLQELGVTAIYLTPFFPAGSTHRYDATTFDTVDPLLGGDAALIALVEAAHARGIRVIGDLTLNHTGVTHEWFERARAGDPETRDFYTFDAALPHGYEAWLGVKSLPKLNYRSERLRARLLTDADSVLRKWLAPPFDLDGWRIDVGNMTARLGAFDANHEVAAIARRVVREQGADKLLVAEHFHDSGPDLPGDGWHGGMNYAAFTKPVWAWLRGDSFAGDWLGLPTRTPSFTGAQMVSSMRSFAARMPWTSWLAGWTILDSHDTARIRSVAGSRERHLAGAVLQMTLPGMPMVFAGDELGAEGLWGEDSRTPHPWHREAAWDHDFLGIYRELIAMRTGSAALTEGGLRWVAVDDDAVGYLRETEGERLLIVAARAATHVRIDATAFAITSVAPIVTCDASAAVEAGVVTISLPGAGGGIWRIA